MIRFLLFIIALAVATLTIGWIGGNPGRIFVQWLGVSLETSVAVIIALFTTATFVLLFFSRLIHKIISAPERFRHARQRAKYQRGLTLLLEAATAGVSGNHRAAARHTQRALTALDRHPVALWLAAQAETAAGNHRRAEQCLDDLDRHQHGKILAIFGKIHNQRNTPEEIPALIRELEHASPQAADVARLIVHTSDPPQHWNATPLRLARTPDSELLEQRRRSIAYDQAINSLNAGRALEALKPLQQAHADAPDDPSCLRLLARALGESGKVRELRRLIETQWRITPDFPAAVSWVTSWPEHDWIPQCQRLVALHPSHPDSQTLLLAVLVARRQWTQAQELCATLPHEAASAEILFLRALVNLHTGHDEERVIHNLASSLWSEHRLDDPGRKALQELGVAKEALASPPNRPT